MRLVLGLAFASSASLLISTALAGEDWPEGYVVHENSESPDHQFGLVVPGSEEASENSDAANCLANLKTHEFLGKLADADYFERQNHRHLNVIWSTDSKTCVVEYQGRFGFDTISVLQVKGTGFQQTDLGRHIEKALVAVVGEEGTGSASYRFAPNNKLLVRALYYTSNPKMIDEDSKQARFAGTLDLISKKWTASETHKTKHWDALSAIYNEPSAVFVTPRGRREQSSGEFHRANRSFGG